MIRFMRVLLLLAVLAVVVYGALLYFLYSRQERLIFYPTVLPADHQYAFAIPFEDVMIPVNGAMINAVHFKADQPTAGNQPVVSGRKQNGANNENRVIFYLHGNGDIIAFLASTAEELTRMGYDVFMPDYRGYGKSTGTITNEEELHADMAIAYGYLLQHYPADQITIYGHSIGSGLAVRLAALYKPERLILESPYYSLSDLIASKVTWAPTDWILKYQLRSDQWVRQVSAPIYLIHGTDDGLIPYAHSQRLMELIEGEKELLTIVNGGHGDLRGFAEWQRFVGDVLE